MVLEGYGNEADKFNGGRSTGLGQQHGGRPLDFEGLKDNNLYDPWNHAWPYYGGFDCTYCSLKHKGGGATRVAEHLGGIVGNVRSCPNVPRNVRDAMGKCRDESKRKKRDKQNSRLRIERNIMEGLYQQGGVINILDDEEEEIQMNIREALCDPNVSRRVERRIGREGVGDVRVSVAAVLDPYTHYKLNLCNHTDYATSLTDAIAKILDPIRAEEDEGKERDIDKEIDPSALLMDTTMFNETNPIMEWLNEDVQDPIMDGADAASAVFEKIRHLNSSRKASYVGSKGSNKKRKRSDDDENEFVETESEDDDGENEYVDNDIEDDDVVSEDDEDGLQDQLETQMQLEEETQVQVEKDTTSIGSLETRRSGRLARKKTKHVHSLYS
ncbi:hypothetical protein ZWY2020_043142 [Hordeum vulgare]|nr:hypothetical protein ZWY2020_043142 [Hordeum vulgare]